MNKLHTKYLKINYPKLFRVCFECGDGWFSLLKDLAEKLDVLQRVSKIRIEASQIKEKFGSMRFYYNEIRRPTKNINIQQVLSEIISDVIHHTEEQAGYTCEECGKHGTINGKGWMKCLCDTCRKKLGK